MAQQLRPAQQSNEQLSPALLDLAQRAITIGSIDWTNKAELKRAQQELAQLKDRYANFQEQAVSHKPAQSENVAKPKDQAAGADEVLQAQQDHIRILAALDRLLKRYQVPKLLKSCS